MKSYTVYFELFGKKMKFSCTAKDAADAKRIVRDRIEFHKIEETTAKDLSELAELIPDELKKIFGIE